MRFSFGSNRSINCVFCRIVEGREPNEILYKDSKYTAFSDIRPASRNHLLIITNEHIHGITHEHVKPEVVDGLVNVANRLLERNGANLDDVRIGFHVPPLITVPHLHLHVIWPYSDVNRLTKWKYKKKSTWFWTPEVAKQWLRDREAKKVLARKQSSSEADAAGASAAQKPVVVQDLEDEDVVDEEVGRVEGRDPKVKQVTRMMARLNKK